MKQPTLSLFYKLFLWLVGITTAAMVLFGYIHIVDSRGNVESDMRNQAKSSLASAMAYFGQAYTLPIQGTETLLAGVSKLDDMLRDSGDMAHLLKPDIERQFIKFSDLHPDMFLSIRFFDKEGTERVSIGQNRRLKHQYNLHQPSGGNIFYQKAASLFNRLKRENRPGLLFEGPFAYQDGRQTLLVGVVKQDPDTGGFHGVFLMHADLTGYLDHLSNTMVFGKKFLLSASHDGRPVTALHDPPPRLDNEDWIVVTDHVSLGAGHHPLLDVTVRIPLDVFNQLVQDDMGALVMAGCISLACIALVSLLVSRNFTRPIVVLQRAMVAVGSGELGKTVVVERGDEIGQLAESFNQMMKRLHHQNKIMEKQAQVVERKVEELSQANRYKSEFLANMSHEIRTPMNAIIGLTDLALYLEMSPRLRDYLIKISHASHSLLRIINDILDFSKVEAGKITLESTDFDLGRVLENLADLFRSKTAEKNLELAMGIDPACPAALHGDPLRLEQVLMNLISNALKFTEQGGVRVWVTCEQKPAGLPAEPEPSPTDGRVVLTFLVQDSGIGLSQEQSDRLFKPFSQADSSTTRQYGGTGLGLSICKRLVELMGGRIWVESRPGHGSLFAFTALFGHRAVPEQLRMDLPPSLGGLPVLVVDDNAIAREILDVTLRSFTFAPVAVASGGEAMTEMRRAVESGTPYPLVLLDYRMPDMDGIETAQRMSALCTQPASPASVPKMVLLSAFGREEELASRANQAGIVAFLSKPVTRSRLFDTIMEALGQKMAHVHQSGVQEIDHRAIADQIGGARVLLVEDNPINQQVAREMLEQVGMRVSVAVNGLEATRMVLESPFDLLFMDIQMPVMDGHTAARRIRENPRFASLPMIAMTAHAMDGDRQRSLEAGMNDHVSKPIDRKRLYAVLLQWIAPGERSREAPVAEKMPTEADGWRMPMGLPGIDVTAGLDRLCNNHTLYRSLLQEFDQDYRHAVETLRVLWAGKRQDDILAAVSLAHAIKGIAGNLGARTLYEAARDLEQCLKRDEREQCAEWLDRLERALAVVLESIASMAEKAAPEAEEGGAPADASINREEVSDTIHKMFSLLKQRDVEAEEHVESLEKLLRGTHMNQELASLAEQIRQFDFDAARSTLSTMAHSLNLPWDGSA
ncbi:MAG: response regulator [Magnetococcus sp. MYC-9]